MKYLFDTDVISALMKRRAPAGLLSRLESLPAESQAISAITVFEVYYGAWRSPDPRRFADLFEATILRAVATLPFGDDAARIAGRLRAEREREGKPMAPGDLQIAATALASGRILVTGNVRHFTGVPGLDVEDWLKEG